MVDPSAHLLWYLAGQVLRRVEQEKGDGVAERLGESRAVEEANLSGVSVGEG
jgi:hypothetical protein